MLVQDQGWSRAWSGVPMCCIQTGAWGTRSALVSPPVHDLSLSRGQEDSFRGAQCGRLHLCKTSVGWSQQIAAFRKAADYKHIVRSMQWRETPPNAPLCHWKQSMHLFWSRARSWSRFLCRTLPTLSSDRSGSWTGLKEKQEEKHLVFKLFKKEGRNISQLVCLLGNFSAPFCNIEK